MTTYNSGTTVSIGGTDYSGHILRTVSVEYGRKDPREQPKPGYASIELVDYWDVVYAFDLNAPVLIKIYNPVTATQQTIFTGRLSDVRVSTYASGIKDGLAVHSITAMSTLADLNRKIANRYGFASYTDAPLIAAALSEAYGTQWDDLGSQYTWDNYPSTITWDALAASTNPTFTADNAIWPFKVFTASETNALEFCQKVASDALGVFCDAPDGTWLFQSTVYRRDQTTALTLPASVLSPELSTVQRSDDVVNSITTTYSWNGFADSLRNEASIVDNGLLDAEREVDLLYQLYDYSTFYPAATNTLGSELQNIIILSARYTQYVYPDLFTVDLANDAFTNAQRDDLIGLLIGQKITCQDIPAAFLPDGGASAAGDFEGFVEGWTWRLTDKQASLALTVSDYRINYVYEG